MTAYIAHIKNDCIRRFIWFFWWPVVQLDIWIKFRKSYNYQSLTAASFWLGYNGIKEKK